MMYEIPIYGYNYIDRINYLDNLKDLDNDDQYSGEEVIFQFLYKIDELDIEPLLTDFGYEIKEHFSNGLSLTMCGNIIQNLLAEIFCDILNGYSKLSKPNITLIEITIVKL